MHFLKYMSYSKCYVWYVRLCWNHDQRCRSGGWDISQWEYLLPSSTHGRRHVIIVTLCANTIFQKSAHFWLFWLCAGAALTTTFKFTCGIVMREAWIVTSAILALSVPATISQNSSSIVSFYSPVAYMFVLIRISNLNLKLIKNKS